MGEPETVRVRECACPGHPHNGEGDWVLLAPSLPLEGGFAAEDDLIRVSEEYPNPEGSSKAQLTQTETARGIALQRRWAVTFIRHAATGWNLLDEQGEPVPFSPEALLADYNLARPVADAAADKYSDSVLAPFQERLARRSQTGRTRDTTSRRQPRANRSSGQSSPGPTAASPR